MRSAGRKWVLSLLLLSVAGAASGARGKTVEVRGGGSELANVAWRALQPGDEVVIDDGHYTGLINIEAAGAPGNPIIIRATAQSHPTIEGALVFSNASYVILDGVTISNPGMKQAAVIIRANSNHVTVRNSTISDSFLGIWIGDHAGMDNRIAGNTVHGNQTHGIAVDLVNAAPRHETVISGNRVYENGIHGIEINASYYIIESNITFANGQRSSGVSGIHVYARDPKQDAGSHNTIRYNISYENIDKSNQDGNGIELDQWCDYNEVYYNVAFGNDGAGIIVFDGSHNKVFNNTVYGNERDPNKTHRLRGELVLASDDDRETDRNADNTVVNNIAVATKNDEYAIYVDKLSSRRNQTIGHNLLFNTSHGNLFFWGGLTGTDVAAWNRLKGGSEDLEGDPNFGDLTSSPTLRFRHPANPITEGRGLELGSLRDATGTPIPSGVLPDLGAYQTQR